MENVPVIDISELSLETLHLQKNNSTVSQLCDAAHQFGVFIVKHDDFKQNNVLDQFRDAMLYFFSLDMDQKLALNVTSCNSRGYNNKELTKQSVDLKEIYDVDHGTKAVKDNSCTEKEQFIAKDCNQWPQFNLEKDHIFQESILNYMNFAQSISTLLINCLATRLKLDDSLTINKLVDDNGNSSFLRLNHYPICTEKAHEDLSQQVSYDNSRLKLNGRLSVGPHTDAGLLTLLYTNHQEPHSLQVLDAKQQKYFTIHPVPDSFIVNIADMLQVYSNDYYASPVHRVLANNNYERYSAPYFFNPNYSAVVQPITTINGASRYRPFTWGHFRSKRFQGDFGDYGSEVQIQNWSTV